MSNFACDQRPNTTVMIKALRLADSPKLVIFFFFCNSYLQQQ